MPPRLQLLLPPRPSPQPIEQHWWIISCAELFCRSGLPSWQATVLVITCCREERGVEGGRGSPGVDLQSYRERGDPSLSPAWEIGARFVQRPGSRLPASML